MPGLHLSLGIFNRLYDLLEDSCEQLDLELAGKLGTTGIGGGASFQRYAELLQQVRQLGEEQTVAKEKLKVLSQLLTYLLVSVTDPNGGLAVTRLRQELAYTQQHITSLVIC